MELLLLSPLCSPLTFHLSFMSLAQFQQKTVEALHHQPTRTCGASPADAQLFRSAALTIDK